MVAPLLDDDMIARRVSVRARDVVYVKSIFEASDGLGALFADKGAGGELIIAAPRDREAELDELLEDLRVELGAVVERW